MPWALLKVHVCDSGKLVATQTWWTVRGVTSEATIVAPSAKALSSSPFPLIAGNAGGSTVDVST